MPTNEEIELKKLKEQRRHNLFTEKGNLITGLVRGLAPKSSFKINDAIWYLGPDPVLGSKFGYLPFTNVLGVPKSDFSSKSAIFGITWLPSLGNMNDDGTLPDLDSSLTDGFKVLRRNNVSTSAFSKGSYALYHEAKMNVAAAIMEVERYLSIANMNVDKLNKSIPFSICNVLNLDYDDLVLNRYNYVSRLNALIRRFNAYADMPETNRMKRYRLLTTSIIQDHANHHKVQHYMYILGIVYKMDITNSTLVPIAFNQAFPEKSGVQKISDFLTIIDDLIKQFETSTTPDDINGNISRAVGNNGFELLEIANDGNDLQCNVITHDEVLCQIQNTEFVMPRVGAFESPASSLRNWQIKMNNASTSLYYPNGRALSQLIGVNDAWCKMVDQRYHVDIYTVADGATDQIRTLYPQGASRHHIVSTYEGQPSKENTVVITRNKINCKNLTFASNTKYHVVSSDSIICFERRIGFFIPTSGYNVPNYYGDTKCVVGLFRMGSFLNLTQLNAVVDYQLYRDIVSQFDWAPIEYLVYGEELSDEDTYPSFAPSNDIINLMSVGDGCFIQGEIDNWTEIDHNQIELFNQSCMLNELALQDVKSEIH